MQLIDIHTHHIPVGGGKLFILNRYPESHLPDLPPGGFFSVGLHPWFIAGNNGHRSQLKRVEEMLSGEGVIAVGECGLDKLTKTEFQVQLEVFMHQAELAEQFNKPLILHAVKTHNDFYHLHRKLQPTVPWLLHGYNGNPMVTAQLLDRGFYFSFGKALLDEGSSAIASLAKLPKERIFLETDDENMQLMLVYEAAAEIMGLSLKQLSEQVEWNFRQVFLRT